MQSSEFVKSATTVEQADPDGLPQVAIAGRSNVGKSSLINTLTRRKGLARTSRTPGRTREINLFRIDDAWHLADLPGYGYAKVPKSVQQEWGRFLEQYLATSDVLRGVLLIFDARRDLRGDDRDLLHWLARLGRPTMVAVTKLDKFGKNKGTSELARWRRALKGLASAPPVGFSSADGRGREELIALLGRCLAGELEAVDPAAFEPPAPKPKDESGGGGE